MKKRIGILGGGQLAKMSTLAAYRLGLTVNILEKEKDSPAGKITPNEFIGWVDDKKLLKDPFRSLSMKHVLTRSRSRSSPR